MRRANPLGCCNHRDSYRRFKGEEPVGVPVKTAVWIVLTAARYVILAVMNRNVFEQNALPVQFLNGINPCTLMSCGCHFRGETTSAWGLRSVKENDWKPHAFFGRSLSCRAFAQA